MNTLSLSRPDDWHLHVRDGALLRRVVPDTATRFARAIIMPNLNPPVTTTSLARQYRERILAAAPVGCDFEPLMKLYLTEEMRPEEIATAKAIRFVHAIKWYPAGATTHSQRGVNATNHPAATRDFPFTLPPVSQRFLPTVQS